MIIADTHAFLWWQLDDPQLSDAGRAAIAEADVAYVSLASIWEMAIKVGIGKLEHARRLVASIDTALDGEPFTLLPVGLRDATRVADLPMHHGDPFDRLLIVQALGAGVPIVSKDDKLDAYGVSRLW